MIREYTATLAAQMGIELSKITVVEGRDVGCLSVHLLHLAVGEKQTSALVHQSELDELQNGSCCDRLESKIRGSLARLLPPASL